MSLQRLQRKSIPNILRQFTEYNLQSKIKTYQKQYTVFIKKKQKKKKNPKTDSVPKRQNQTKTSIVVVAVAKLAHRRRWLAIACPSSQSQIVVSPLIADRSAQIRTSGAQLAASPLAVAVGVSGAHLKPQGISKFSLFFSLSLSIFISLKSESVKEK